MTALQALIFAFILVLVFSVWCFYKLTQIIAKTIQENVHQKQCGESIEHPNKEADEWSKKVHKSLMIQARAIQSLADRIKKLETISEDGIVMLENEAEDIKKIVNGLVVEYFKEHHV